MADVIASTCRMLCERWGTEPAGIGAVPGSVVGGQLVQLLQQSRMLMSADQEVARADTAAFCEAARSSLLEVRPTRLLHLQSDQRLKLASTV